MRTVFCAQVVSIEPHPAADAPKNWHKVTVKIGEAKEQHFEVVCGGEGYAIGDRVAYVPVGNNDGVSDAVKSIAGLSSRFTAVQLRHEALW